MKYRPLILLIHLINAQPNVDLDLFIVDRMNSGYIPGLSACAIINDQVVWTNSYGFANITLNIPVSDDTNFLLASISKLVTTTAIIQIVENEDIALNDDYFKSRKLYPNVDFYSGIIYRAMGIPTNMFTVMFALGRLPGWLAHWREMVLNPDSRINRPRQIYTGNTKKG